MATVEQDIQNFQASGERNLAELKRVLSEEKKVKVSACHQNRFNLAIQQTRNALEAGRFGKLSHGSINVRWNRNQDYYTQETPYRAPAYAANSSSKALTAEPPIY